jgi:hypothetical protein
LLAFAHGEAEEIARKVTPLEGEHAVARQARGATEAKLPGLVDRSVDADQRWEEDEGECAGLVELLTLLWIRGTK